MIAVTCLFHVTAIIVMTHYLNRVLPIFDKTPGEARAMVILFVIVLGIVLIHTVEVSLWAVLYLLAGEFATMERALYFSLVTFSTLGYGDVVLNERYQLLSGFEAFNGIILFGISTAFAFAVLRRLFEFLLSGMK